MVNTATAKRDNIENPVLAEIYNKYQSDNIFFVEHCLGHYTWSKQREILKSIVEHEYTAVRASHSVSKTYTAAEIAVWFLNTFPDSKVITTAPTGRQVKDLLWAEIGKDYRTSRYGLEGECLTLSVRTDKAEHYIEGFSSDRAVSFEGFHAPQILFILDEAKGIPQWVWDSVEGSMTGGYCRCLAISTTDGVNPGEYYHKIFNDPRLSKKWNKISISAYDSPYVTGELFRYIEIPDRLHPEKFDIRYKKPAEVLIQLASPKWIAGRKDEWDEDSVLFITKVKGEICDIGLNNIVQLSEVLKMFENGRDDNFDDEGAIEIGADIARFGEDTTIFYKRKGMKITGRQSYAKQDTKETSDKIETFADGDKSIRIKVDDTGLGGGVTDNLRRDGYNVVPINFQSLANKPNKYPNIISEMWYETSKLVKEIACPRNEKLQAELVNRKNMGLDKKGRRTIESKKEYKKRGFKSPDDADAFLLCFYKGRNELRIR